MGNKKAILVPELYKKTIHNEFQRLDVSYFIPSRGGEAEVEYRAEMFCEIYTFGFFETTNYLRDTLKKIDTLLDIGGKLIIDYFTAGEMYSGGHFIRPFSFFQYELSLSLGKRFKLIEKKQEGNITKLVYEKVESRLAINDSIYAWTFGIVSDGKKDERILAIIQQIRAFKIPQYEILICGPKPYFELADDIKVLDDSDLYWDLRVPITAKKNRLINHASFENIVLMHDRISFSSFWFEKIKQYGNNFEILCNTILDEDTFKLRVQDWVHVERDFFDYKNIKAGALKYSDWNPTLYVDGGFIITKTSILRSINGYNEALNWGEAEDVDLSKRLYQSGYMTNIDLNNTVFTQTHRHKGIDNNSRFKKKNKLILLKNILKKKLKLYLQKQEYLRMLD